VFHQNRHIFSAIANIFVPYWSIFSPCSTTVLCTGDFNFLHESSDATVYQLRASGLDYTEDSLAMQFGNMLRIEFLFK
jgi:hypothetical protein